MINRLLKVKILIKIEEPNKVNQPESGTTQQLNENIVPQKKTDAIEIEHKDEQPIQTLKELEYKAIVAGLDRNNWNMTTTSQELGISRMTLYRKLDQHGLRKKDSKI